jgi:hypothetical protein
MMASQDVALESADMAYARARIHLRVRRFCMYARWWCHTHTHPHSHAHTQTTQDVALESADMVLMRGKLQDVLTAISLSQAIFRRIKLNFAWAFGYNW